MFVLFWLEPIIPRSAPSVKSERSFYNCPVPRVSEAHLAARRQQIIDAARACFLRNGFHNTSMQDVIAEAGLSVGAVYRYFPSKYELVTALAEQVIAQVTGAFDQLAAVEPALPIADVIQGAVETAAKHTGPDGALRLAVQVWAEAMHDPRLAEFVAGVYSGVRARLTALAARARDAGEFAPDTDPEDVASVIFALLPGFALQRILIGVPEPASFQAGIRALFGRPR
jgi:AcrR family transcriptional regulator